MSRVDAIIGLRREEVGDRMVGHIPVAEHTRNAAGGLRSAVMLSAMDATGGFAAGLASLPGWTVSTSLMAVIGRPDHAGPLRFDARVVRTGRSSVVASVDVHDEGNADHRVAQGLLSAAVLDPAAGPQLVRPVRIEPPPLAPPVPSLEDSFGIAPGNGPTTTLDLREPLRNRWGILHGGAIALVAEVAAARAVGGGEASGAVLHFLRPARVGPVEARCRVAGRRRDADIVIVSVHDAGSDDRQVALASVTVLRG